MKDVKAGDRIKVTTDMPDGQPIRLGDELTVTGVNDDGKFCAVLAHDESNVLFFLIEAWFDVIHRSDDAPRRNQGRNQMSRFTVGQEITVAKTQGDVTYGNFYPVTHINDGDACILDDVGDVDHITDDFGLTRAEYEQAEREKDPFAPGKWVVCVEDDYPARKGNIIQVLEASDALGCFRVWDTIESSGHEVCLKSRFRKSRFRPATPEEIKEQEKQIMDEKRVDEAHEDRQTFTVGGREFYVGQSAWLKSAFIGLPKDSPVEILGYNYGGDVLAVREAGSILVGFVPSLRNITTTKPKPHEWKFGDWARHPECGVLFVTDIGDEDEDGDREIEAVMKDGTAVVLGDFELTYISTAEIPE